MAAPPETAEAPASPEREESQDGVEVCLFDESSEGFSRAVRAISELTAGEPEPRFPDAEVERLASSVTFLREWRHFSYEPKDVTFANGAGPASSRDDTHRITLPQFSSASVSQITSPLDEMDSTHSSDFILFAGGSVWALDWCPRLYGKPYSPVNCEYLAVAAHPPNSSYHKLGLPLTGRGIIQVWCLVAPFEEVNPHQPVFACNKNKRRGRPRKTPEENNSVESSNPPKPRGRPRKRTITTSDDHSEPSLKRPRGRPRKYPLPLAIVEGSSQNNKIQDFSLIDPPVTSTVVPGDLELARVIPTVASLESTPKRSRGRPRKKTIDNIKDSSGIEFKGYVSTTRICLEPKKKRGNPPKYPAPSNSKHISSTACEAMKTSGSNTANATPNCSIGHVQKNQVAHVPFDNNPHVISEAKDPKLASFKESGKNDTMSTSEENPNVSPVPKDISLPRIVLCLAHNGKVAWDIKWKPPIPCQSEQISCLGFLAILLGNGSLEVWEIPSPSMIQSIYSSAHSMEGTDPRFLKLQPVFRCARVNCGSRQSIPLTVDWSPSPPHDMILAGCHDGTVALWKFNTELSSQGADSKPFMCITAESVPIRALSWAPYVSGEGTNTFVTAGEDGLKFWDLRDPYRPLWELTTAPRAVLSLHWLKDARGIVISLEDGTLKFLNLLKMANDVPVTGRPFIGTKTQGVSTYQLSEYLIWSVHVSETTGYAAYCVADGTAVHFELTSRFWEKEPGRNRVPYYLCGSVLEEKTTIKIGVMLQNSPLSNVPLMSKKGANLCQNVEPVHDIEKEKLLLTDSGYGCAVNPEIVDGRQDGHDQGKNTGAIALADPTMQHNAGIYNNCDGESPQEFEVFPPKVVALHRLRWNMNKGSERWLCYGGAAGIIRCQRI